jgi:hypothetical protein
MQSAAKEAVAENGGSKNIAITVDETWQERGHTSLNVVVVTATIVYTGKIIDVECLSKFCHGCEKNTNCETHELICVSDYA